MGKKNDFHVCSGRLLSKGKDCLVLQTGESPGCCYPFTYNLEVNASQIYHCIRKKTNDEFILGMFKAISKVELEHAELVCKLIDKDPGCEIPFNKELCTENRKKSLGKTKILETNAINFYKKFLHEATEPREKNIFQALVEIEQDHLDLVNANLSMARMF